jgi:ABC-type Mn2+/Zn2+ transport system permease subunit
MDIQYAIDQFVGDKNLQMLFLSVILTGLLCSLLSTFVVIKRMALAGTGIGGAALTGAFVGIAFLPSLNMTQWQILAIAGVSAFAVALIIMSLKRCAAAWTDALLGVFVIGIIVLWIISVLEWGMEIPDLTVYLIGSSRIMSDLDVYILSGATALIFAIVLLCFKPLCAICIDADYAKVLGNRVGLLEFIFIGLLTATVLFSIYYVNYLFTVALLIFPGLCGRLVSVQLWKMVAVSISIGVSSCIFSVFLSKAIVDWPSTIILVVIQLALAILIFGSNRIRALNA